MDQHWINKLHLTIFAVYEFIFYKIEKSGSKKRKFDHYMDREQLSKKGHLELKIMAEHHMCILKGAKVYFYQEYGKKVKLPDAFNRAKAQEEAKRFVDGFASKYTFGYLKDIAGDYEEILKDNLDDK